LAGAQVDKIQRALGTLLFLTVATRAISGCIASGINIAGFFIRGCILFILLSLFLFCFCLLSGRKSSRPHNDDVWQPDVSTFLVILRKAKNLGLF
jgi:hypothetical protein